MKNKAIFLDRDGVINKVVYHKEMGIVDSPSSVDQFILLPDVGKAINKFHELGFIVLIVSNQPGLAKDNYDSRRVREYFNFLVACKISRLPAPLPSEKTIINCVENAENDQQLLLQFARNHYFPNLAETFAPQIEEAARKKKIDLLRLGREDPKDINSKYIA